VDDDRAVNGETTMSPFAYHRPIHGGLDRLLVPLLGGDNHGAAAFGWEGASNL
jgi:hypothetical protein